MSTAPAPVRRRPDPPAARLDPVDPARRRRRLRVDVVAAVAFGLVCLPFALLGNAADLVALVGFTAALSVRRFAPAWSLGIAWAAAIVQMAALRDLQPYDLAVIGVLYSTAAHGGRTLKWVGLASACGGAIVATAYLGVAKTFFAGPGDAGATGGMRTLLLVLFLFVSSLAVLVLAWTAGLLVRAVRDGREIRRREEVATRERELAEYRFVVEQERNRIARDMHDVVAHSLAVVIAQADGARFAARARPEAAADALGTIAGVARGALGDVRLLLAELRHAEGGAPQPAVDDLGELVERMRATGLVLEFAEHGDRVPLGAPHEIAIYRIVQEALTNALRHGDTAQPVRLELEWGETSVGILVENAVRPEDAAADEPRSLRHGIPGMRERAQLAGGTLVIEADPTRFAVRAGIPTAARVDA
ncbi:sensor histidine kinase [Agromyces sp. MMS24-JH15]|uniref:sensor histidine kinase n=1 Tax=Agromyces sp. MMS24-JH15 TaxID=3243765 RepID=UPI00374A9182